MKLRTVLYHLFVFGLVALTMHVTNSLLASSGVMLSGVLVNGIFGEVSGKIGGVVFGSWKGINYGRGYTIPKNPNTALQQSSRTKFSALVGYAQDLLPTLIPFAWDPFAVKMSGFNYWIKENYAFVDGSNIISVDNIMSKGTLEPPPLSSFTYDTLTGEVACTFSDTINGNGLLTDETNLVAFNKDTKKIYVELEAGARSVGQSFMTIPTGITATDLVCFLFASRGTGSEFIVSDSQAAIASAA